MQACLERTSGGEEDESAGGLHCCEEPIGSFMIERGVPRAGYRWTGHR